jgi:hypothetical protein
MGNSKTTPSQSERPLADAALKLCEEADADIVILAGGMYDPLDYDLHAKFRKHRRRDNVVLLMATFGGSPDVAYKVSRLLQKSFKRFIVIIDAFCKSGGTLTAVGAHEIVMSQRAELGPLDIQLGEIEDKQRRSGLAPVQALKILQEQAAEAHIKMFEAINDRLEVQAKTAMTMADHVVSSLFAEIYKQLEPIKLAEYERAMTIMKEYGSRLADGSKNLKDGALERLIRDYPDHSFVIDRYEAEELFSNVREPNQTERELLDLLNGLFAQHIYKRSGLIEYLAIEPASNTGDANGEQSHHRTTEGNDHELPQPQAGEMAKKARKAKFKGPTRLKKSRRSQQPAWNIDPESHFRWMLFR